MDKVTKKTENIMRELGLLPDDGKEEGKDGKKGKKKKK